MSGDILARLVDVTKYFRQSQTEQSFLERIQGTGKNKFTSIKKVTIHLYKGETLGITGIKGSGKTVLGQLIAKVVEPSSGKVRNNVSTFLASDSTTTHSVSQFIESVLLSYNVPLTEYSELKADILKFAELSEKEKAKVSGLNEAERAQLLIALTYFLEPEVVIYNDLTRHLSASFKKKFAMVIDALTEVESAVVLMEEKPELIPYKAHYVSWLSHGQLRKSGDTTEVLADYVDYYKRFEAVQGTQKEDLFDLDYKIQRQSDQPENYKRINRHMRSYMDSDLKKWLLTSLVLLVLSALFFILILKDVQYTPEVDEKPTAINQQRVVYTDKYALAVVRKNSPITFKGQTVAQLPEGSLVEITGIGTDDYRISFEDKEMKMAKKNLLYINPAALYDERTFDELNPYMYSNYVNFHQFFNGFLGASRSKVEEGLYPEKRQRYVIKLTKNDIYLQFNNQNQVSGLRFPMRNADKLKKKFGIKDNNWIVKVDNGYAVADFESDMWLYFRR
ncbi:ABC transporter ATP-binding protein [Macrococcus brunensis]|uniref:ABC transporter ATP-binding protein n=1 Tax=Macrococcus brunensis TaxID=198483 RepID=A0A4R6BEY8_9STAP|nr:ATP-binding cassette domain-containing protein [Macrococcus brunensis]TDL98339.1 ABC transporter ATP-binding protein [Macrococcus brunensis]ULG71520.1 ATP-binding cassette domain-containing protein [Macrococcus brunensis]ULG73784.1 ATP-binding cassette domain-containing protein [Macrococcus brunensis]